MSPVPLGIVASAHRGSGGDRLVRSTSAINSAASSTLTVTFTEPTALGSTYLLVALVSYSSGSRVLSASGWTKASGGGGTALSEEVFAKQGDGSTNSITVTTTISAQRFIVTLLAFAGYSSTTALNGNGADFSTVSSAAVTPSSTPSGYGVALAFAATAGNPTWNAWTNSFTANTSGALVLGSNLGTHWSARKEYTGSGGSYSSTASWSGSVTGRTQSVIFPLTP